MSCRSCGLGPSRPVIRKQKVDPTINRNKPPKGLVTASKKVTIPTRSPPKTFTTVGDP